MVPKDRRYKINGIIKVVIYLALAISSIIASYQDNYLKAIFFVLLLILMEIADLNPRNRR